MRLEIDVADQSMRVLDKRGLRKTYLISTAAKGVGEQNGSECTPLGKHIIRAKIGHDAEVGSVFVGRRQTGEIYTPALRERFPGRDWILTRILWLSGTEVGKNRLGACDSMRRYIYIHGSPDDVEMGRPGSRGCIRMRNQDIIELFDMISAGTEVNVLVADHEA